MEKMSSAAFVLQVTVCVVVASVTATPASPAREAAGRWPAIVASQGTVSFLRGGSAAVDVFVMTVEGKPEYLLRCLTVESQPQNSTVDYLGDFECRLLPYGSPAGAPSLLRDSEVQSEWDSRGAFYRAELEGACGLYPEYGRLRHFRLRGLELKLELSEIEFRQGVRSQPLSELKSFRFTWAIRPDPGAMSATAELPTVHDPLQKPGQGPLPARNCETVRHRRSLF